ncbi:MAG: glucokinase [Phenylobacterium sp.]|uniref:glucokinase n=1 Tax=Phenylobacterium sp. TaxID=1871053 RepID=UPI0027352436|nr:glucokinase [Phenylobacterium sp.]MDP3174362.1 glucokinase [Phenylobacterium sp.]
MRGLVGDVGGTNARFALVDQEGHIRFPRIFPAKEYASLTDIIAEYLETTAGRKRPPRAAIAVAGPVVDGEIEFTNLHWRLSEVDLVAAFEFEEVSLINDFAAQALAAPRMGVDDLRVIGPKLRGSEGCPMVVMGAGTGFGVAGLARSSRGDVALATEGGHAGFSPYDDLEVEVWRRLKAKHGRVSNERLLSGQGLFDLHVAMRDMEGVNSEATDEKKVFEMAQAGDRLALATLERFCAIMGSVAGDLALTYGARGGVYISGGIAPRMPEQLAAGAFRARFEDKGRLSDYVSAIPTSLILHPYPALVGAARELAQLESVRI